MFYKNIAQKILFEPISQGADALLILTSYATPNMASWMIKTLQERKLGPIKISLVIGMTPYNGLSISAHEGFKELHDKEYQPAVSSFACEYAYDTSPIHANLYVWLKDNQPVTAFTGSADFMQNSFIPGRIKSMSNCDPAAAYTLFSNIEAKSIYCNHGEVEDCILIRPTHSILDEDNNPLTSLSGEGIISVTLPFLTYHGDVGKPLD